MMLHLRSVKPIEIIQTSKLCVAMGQNLMQTSPSFLGIVAFLNTYRRMINVEKVSQYEIFQGVVQNLTQFFYSNMPYFP